jgi:hypothetical protein
MIMEKIANNALCPLIGISLPSSVKAALLKAYMILFRKNVSAVPTTLLFGMARFAPNAPFKVPSGMENTATTVPLNNIGMLQFKNA